MILRTYPDQPTFLASFNHTNISRAMAKEEVKTVGEAYLTGKIKLSDIRDLYREDTPHTLIETWINQMAIYLGLPADKDQIRELAWSIYEEAHFLNIRELALFFTRAKRGHYGPFYNRIDPAEIMRWLRDYRAERGQYLSKLPDDYKSPELARAREEFENSKKQQQ